MKKYSLFIITVVFLTGVQIPSSAVAASAGYELVDDFITLAGSIKQEVMGMQDYAQGENPTESLSQMIKHSEMMLRILNSGYRDMEKHKTKTYVSPAINKAIEHLETVILALRDTNASAKAQYSEMMLPTIREDLPTVQKLMSEFMIKNGEDSVTIDESYRMIMYFTPMAVNALVKEENGVMVRDVTLDELKRLKERVIFYYGDEAKNEPAPGQKHIVATGNMLWAGLSNLENPATPEI